MLTRVEPHSVLRPFGPQVHDAKTAQGPAEKKTDQYEADCANRDERKGRNASSKRLANQPEAAKETEEAEDAGEAGEAGEAAPQVKPGPPAQLPSPLSFAPVRESRGSHGSRGGHGVHGGQASVSSMEDVHFSIPAAAASRCPRRIALSVPDALDGCCEDLAAEMSDDNNSGVAKRRRSRKKFSRLNFFGRVIRG